MAPRTLSRAPSAWRVGAEAETASVIIEKDPSVPWTEDEIKRRIWALESRDQRQKLIDVIALLATVVSAGMAVAAFAYARQGRQG
jgi:hypothetical protein